MRVCVCALARVCALPLGERRSEDDDETFSRFHKIEAFSQNERQKQNPKLMFCLSY